MPIVEGKKAEEFAAYELKIDGDALRGCQKYYFLPKNSLFAGETSGEESA